MVHCKPRKQDVFIKMQQTQDNDSDIDQFAENTKNLIIQYIYQLIFMDI